MSEVVEKEGRKKKQTTRKSNLTFSLFFIQSLPLFTKNPQLLSSFPLRIATRGLPVVAPPQSN